MEDQRQIQETARAIAAGILERFLADRNRAARAELEALRLRKAAEEQAAAEAQAIEAQASVVITGDKRHHVRFPLVLAAAKAGVDCIALVGPAGTGKSTASRLAAEHLGRKFETITYGRTTSKSDLFGFIAPKLTGDDKYVDTGLVRVARDGGVFMGDELDNGHAGVVTMMNTVVANPVFGTPGGMVTKHPDAVFMVGMNTFGDGGDRMYMREQLDAASKDRMFFIYWPIDWGLVHHINGVRGIPSEPFDIAEGGTCSAYDWTKFVQRISEAVEALKLRCVVGQRAALMGLKLLNAGIGRRWVEDGLIWKGMDQASRDKVNSWLVNN